MVVSGCANHFYCRVDSGWSPHSDAQPLPSFDGSCHCSLRLAHPQSFNRAPNRCPGFQSRELKGENGLMGAGRCSQMTTQVIMLFVWHSVRDQDPALRNPLRRCWRSGGGFEVGICESEIDGFEVNLGCIRGFRIRFHSVDSCDDGRSSIN